MLGNAGWTLLVVSACVLAFLAGRGGLATLEPNQATTTAALDGKAMVTPASPDWLRQATRRRSRDEFLAELREIEQHSDKTVKKRHLGLVLRGWLDHDPLAALEAVRGIGALRFEPARAVDAFGDWAANSPLAAADLIRQAFANDRAGAAGRAYIDGVDPPDILLGVVWGMTGTDPELACDVISRMPKGLFRTAATEVFLGTDYQRDPQRSQRWVASMPPGAVRREGIRMVAEKIGQSADPPRDFDWVAKLDDRSERAVAVAGIAGQWARRHAREAFAWAAALADADLKWAAVPAAIEHLTILDPDAAADWLNQFEAAPELDAAVAAYVRVLRHLNPEAALGSTGGITDPRLRAKLQSSLARQASAPIIPNP
jgi:hypothetical protein